MNHYLKTSFCQSRHQSSDEVVVDEMLKKDGNGSNVCGGSASDGER